MPRERSRPPPPPGRDPVHHSPLVTQLVNKVMLHGKRSLAQTLVYDAMETIGRKTGEESLAVLKRAIDNVKPPLEVKSRRVGGATYQVPVEVRSHRATTLAIRWVVDYARARCEEDDGRLPRRRADGRRQRARRVGQEARRHAEDGGVQQGLRPLPLLRANPAVDDSRGDACGHRGRRRGAHDDVPQPVGRHGRRRRRGPHRSPPAPLSRRAAPHAEREALRHAGAGSSWGVRWSPRSSRAPHTGRTPPCVDAIVDAGIHRIVVGIEDPIEGRRAGHRRVGARPASRWPSVSRPPRIEAQLAPYLTHRRTGRP